MIFSVSNEGIQWTLDFRPDSVTITVKDLDQNITIISQEIPLAAWELLLSQTQHFLDNLLPRIPITQNQERTMEVRDETLSSVRAHDLDTSSYQLTYLEAIEFNWENSQLDLVFRPGKDTPSLQQHLTIYRSRDQLKTPLNWTKRKSRRTLLLLHRHPSLSDPWNFPGCRESRFWSKSRKCTRLCF